LYSDQNKSLIENAKRGAAFSEFNNRSNFMTLNIIESEKKKDKVYLKKYLNQ
jgi:hypothetical protein